MSRNKSVIEQLKNVVDGSKVVDKDLISNTLPKIANEYRKQIAEAFEQGKLHGNTSKSGDKYYDTQYGEINKIFIPEQYRIVRFVYTRPAFRGDDEWRYGWDVQPDVERTGCGYYYIDAEGEAKVKIIGGGTIYAESVISWEYVPDQVPYLLQNVIKSKKFLVLGHDKKALSALKKLMPELLSAGCIHTWRTEISDIKTIDDIFTYKPSKKSSEWSGPVLGLYSDGSMIVYSYFDTRKWLDLTDGIEVLNEIGIDADELEIDAQGPDTHRLTVQDVKDLKKVLSDTKSYTYTPITEYEIRDHVTKIEEVNASTKTFPFKHIYEKGCLYFMDDGPNRERDNMCTVKEAQWLIGKLGGECVVAPEYNRRENGGGYYLVNDKGVESCSYSTFWNHSGADKMNVPIAKRIECDSIESGILKFHLYDLSDTSFYTDYGSSLHYENNLVINKINKAIKVGDVILRLYNSRFYDISLGNSHGKLPGHVLNDKAFDYSEFSNLIEKNDGKYEIVSMYRITDSRIYIANN